MTPSPCTQSRVSPCHTVASWVCPLQPEVWAHLPRLRTQPIFHCEANHAVTLTQESPFLGWSCGFTGLPKPVAFFVTYRSNQGKFLCPVTTQFNQGALSPTARERIGIPALTENCGLSFLAFPSLVTWGSARLRLGELVVVVGDRLGSGYRPCITSSKLPMGGGAALKPWGLTQGKLISVWASVTSSKIYNRFIGLHRNFYWHLKINVMPYPFIAIKITNPNVSSS